jgi:cholesterol transport system auxiliary component
MRQLAATATAVVVALLAGCVSVQIGGEGARHVNLVLADARPSMARRTEPAARALLVQAVAADPLANTRSIAYARSPGTREFYQLASWTEPPAQAVTRLLLHRLEARGTFAAVALLGQPIEAEWLLTIGVEAVYHDVAAEPGASRLAVRAELIDRRTRTLAARRSFDVAAAVAQATSTAAAFAMGQAVADIFDAIVPWIEEQLVRASSVPRAAANREQTWDASRGP